MTIIRFKPLMENSFLGISLTVFKFVVYTTGDEFNLVSLCSASNDGGTVEGGICRGGVFEPR